MNVRSFRISTTDRVSPSRWWLVRFHPDLDDLRDAAYRYRPWEPRPESCLAICQPAAAGSSGFAGVLRFVPEFMNGEVMAHELVHAAAAVYRSNVDVDIQLGGECGEPEEAFAYIYGELYQSLIDRLHDA